MGKYGEAGMGWLDWNDFQSDSRTHPLPPSGYSPGEDAEGENGVTSLLTYASLFAIAFLAATLLPVQSEAVLAGLLALSNEPWWALLTVATIGNTLGAVVNWALGLYIERFQNRRWFPASPAQLEKAKYYYTRYGRWCLFFSWLPIVGDAFTVIAGVLKERLWIFVVIVGAGKLARYIVVAAAVASSAMIGK
jgi:membrane protein YqaA with SNARE-associated domain